MVGTKVPRKEVSPYRQGNCKEISSRRQVRCVTARLQFGRRYETEWSPMLLVTFFVKLITYRKQNNFNIINYKQKSLLNNDWHSSEEARSLSSPERMTFELLSSTPKSAFDTSNASAAWALEQSWLWLPATAYQIFLLQRKMHGWQIRPVNRVFDTQNTQPDFPRRTGNAWRIHRVLTNDQHCANHIRSVLGNFSFIHIDSIKPRNR